MFERVEKDGEEMKAKAGTSSRMRFPSLVVERSWILFIAVLPAVSEFFSSALQIASIVANQLVLTGKMLNIVLFCMTSSTFRRKLLQTCKRWAYTAVYCDRKVGNRYEKGQYYFHQLLLSRYFYSNIKKNIFDPVTRDFQVPLLSLSVEIPGDAEDVASVFAEQPRAALIDSVGNVREKAVNRRLQPSCRQRRNSPVRREIQIGDFLSLRVCDESHFELLC